jgi:hypothetical protein
MDVSRKNPRILLRIEANAIMPAALNKYSFFNAVHAPASSRPPDMDRVDNLSTLN